MTALEELLETPLATAAAAGPRIDCLVIGSGTAGVTTALALAERGYRCVILEAGPLVLLDHVGNLRLGQRQALLSRLHERVTYATRWSEPDAAAEAEARTAWSVVGGRTLFWSGCAPRYNPWDFADWPIPYREFAPSYEQAERLIRVSAAGDPDRPAYFQSRGQAETIRRLQDVGLSARPAPLGVDTKGARNRSGRGFDSAAARLVASDHFGQFACGARVSLVAQATALVLHLQRGRVASVEARDERTGGRATLAPRHVVLAGGALQSTRLALSAGLDRLSPQVGRFITDHLFVQGVARIASPLREGDMNIFVDATETRPFHVQVQGCFRETWYPPTNSTLWADCQPDGIHIMLACFGVATVDGDNRVELAAPAEPGGSGLRDYRVVYRQSSRDRQRIEAMQRSMTEVAAAMGATMLRSAVNPPGSALHEAGGLRMSADPESGVTDRFGRFWRVSNLSVADAAAFPSQGSANSYLSITAWSLRHAAALADSLAAG